MDVFPLSVLEMFLQLEWNPAVVISIGLDLERHTPGYIGTTVYSAGQSS